jgi:ubiquinone/menaquinone biosynthesis C-methylase UbiE
MTQAINTFALKSDAYAQARPRYPQALYDWIAAQCGAHEAAWDCATGNGQAAVDLASRFATVHATDISPEQVRHAVAAPHIVYSVQGAEHTDFRDSQFDLVTVAQALHWFDFRAFWPEVRRVCKAGAFFCAFGYGWFDSDPEVDRLLAEPFRQILDPHWAPQNRMLLDGYPSQAIQFPFERAKAPELAIRVTWTVPQIIAYMQTWSAYKRSQEHAAAARELSGVVARAMQHLADRGPVEITMSLAIAAGRVTPG